MEEDGDVGVARLQRASVLIEIQRLIVQLLTNARVHQLRQLQQLQKLHLILQMWKHPEFDFPKNRIIWSSCWTDNEADDAYIHHQTIELALLAPLDGFVHEEFAGFGESRQRARNRLYVAFQRMQL